MSELGTPERHVSTEDQAYETHTHTPLCKHAVGLPGEYAEAAFRRGLRGLVVTCHNPMPDGFAPHVRMGAEQFDEYVDLVAEAREFWSGRVDVRLGLEADYFPGFEGWLERQLDSAKLDYALGSVHPQLPEFVDQFGGGTALDLQRAYFRLMGDAAETGLFDCLAHPNIVKIVVPSEWDPAVIMDDIRRALDRIAAAGVALELNTSGIYKPVPEMNPFPAMLAEMQQRSIPVVIGSDAHEPARVGDGFEEGLLLLEEAGYDRVSIFLNRVRRELPIATFRERLLSVE